MANYTLQLWDEQGCKHDVDFEAPSDSSACSWAADNAASEAKDWVDGGSWDASGCSVCVNWRVVDSTGALIDSDWVEVDVPADEEALIPRTLCGDKPSDHDWTSEGCGGLKENPGVWSVGGTAMVFLTRCRNCGLERREHHCGSQRNPGEHDTIEFRFSDSE